MLLVGMPCFAITFAGAIRLLFLRRTGQSAQRGFLRIGIAFIVPALYLFLFNNQPLFERLICGS